MVEFDTDGFDRGDSEDDLSQQIWHKPEASMTPGGNCVEVAAGRRGFAVRDSKYADGPVLRFSPGHWNAFIGAIKRGTFGNS